MKKSLLFLLLIPSICLGQIYQGQTVSVGNIYTLKQFTVSLDGTGSADICTASGNLGIIYVMAYVTTAPTGLTSTALVTTDTTPVTLMAATLLVNLTGGKSLTSLQTAPFILGDTKKIQRVNVGTGTGAGILTVQMLYFKGTGDCV